MEHNGVILLNNLGGFKRGRFWHKSVPFRLGYNTKSFIGSIYQPKVFSFSSFQICCEIALLPRDTSNYGLLGLEFIPLEGDSIQYEILYLENPSEILLDNVAIKGDKVYKGITKEFAIAIRDVMEQLGSLEIPIGKYSFITSAHGIVGSSRRIFTKLTLTLLRLASENPNVSNIEKMKSIIANEIGKS